MLPIGPLMIEHRLIERMLKAAKQALERAVKEKKLDPVFIETVTDFVKAYADRCHHGKEEDKHFFMPIMALFSKEEKDAMPREGYEFDSKLIHREYQDIVMKAEQFIRL